MRLRLLGLAALVFIIEVMIALYVHDRIVRPFVGDVLVVVLLYCAAAAIAGPSVALARGVLVFSFTIEGLQALDYVALLHLQHVRVACIVLGRTFEWTDLVAYVVGYFVVRVTSSTHASIRRRAMLSGGGTGGSASAENHLASEISFGSMTISPDSHSAV